MTRTGFDDPEPEGRDPEELRAWIASGFSTDDAEVWRRWRFTIAEAGAWKVAGVEDGLHAAQWSTAGVNSSTVESWKAAGIDAPEAVRWHEFGYDLEAARSEKSRGHGPLDAFANQHPIHAFPGTGIVGAVRLGALTTGGRVGPARQFRERGVDPRLMHGYIEHQWMDESAVEWASRGIAADDAYVWFELDLTPAEASRLVAQGRSPSDVIREWWSAGIPLSEVADWIGAGLNASEAVEQRARGITAEHAAALRALRADDAPNDASGPPRRLPLRRHGPPASKQFGPPPEDEATARAEITEAFSAMLTRNESSNSIPAVEEGNQLFSCLTQLTTTLEARGTSSVVVTLDEVQFINDHQAQVSFNVKRDEISGPVFHDHVGRAVMIDGKWKVERDTFCQLIGFMGVECPPRLRTP